MDGEQSMFQIKRFTCEGLEKGCVTDEQNPVFSFSLQSDQNGISLLSADLAVGHSHIDAMEQIAVPYEGEPLKPFTEYTASIRAAASNGEEAEAQLTFETGRMGTPWSAQWISDPNYHFTEAKVSPIPMQFRKVFTVGKPVKKAKIYATAMGIYELELNGKKVGNRYFAPGFTSYKTNLQYQTYDITDQLKDENRIDVFVAGGWAAGSFVFTRVNRVHADRQALLMELR
ncbi:MAG: alpha-L-rhamnosidase N-terminal domain-containing protein, partial [Clostridia bacterium]|nr:alpha-L-rhamnosidase N-terminal domain-containing protein [Clostridia bacterium]